MTLGRLGADCLMPVFGCGFAGAGLVAVDCPKPATAAASVITAASGRVTESQVGNFEKRPNIRLLWRGWLLGAPRLLICFCGRTLGGGRFGSGPCNDRLLGGYSTARRNSAMAS